MIQISLNGIVKADSDYGVSITGNGIKIPPVEPVELDSKQLPQFVQTYNEYGTTEHHSLRCPDVLNEQQGQLIDLIA